VLCQRLARAKRRPVDDHRRRYVIVKLCEKKEELEKFQTKTVSNDTNPEFDESHKFKGLKHPGKLKLKFEIWDSVTMPRLA
jgi:hypothetical protein